MASASPSRGSSGSARSPAAVATRTWAPGSWARHASAGIRSRVFAIFAAAWSAYAQATHGSVTATSSRRAAVIRSKPSTTLVPGL